jgi:hypothetical protein
MSISIDDDAIEAIVRAVKKRMGASESAAAAPVVDRYAPPKDCGGGSGHSCTSDPRPIHSVQDPAFEAMLPPSRGAHVLADRRGPRGQRAFARTSTSAPARATPTRATPCTARSRPTGPSQHELIPLRDPLPRPRRVPALPNHGRRSSETSRAAVRGLRGHAPTCRSSWATGSRPTPSCRTARPPSRPCRRRSRSRGCARAWGSS